MKFCQYLNLWINQLLIFNSTRVIMGYGQEGARVINISFYAFIKCSSNMNKKST